MHNTNIVLNKIKGQLDAYVGQIFENICRELLMLYNGNKLKNHKINFEKIGSWWEGGQEIDSVAYSKREVLLGEVKWSNEAVNGLTLLNSLERKSKLMEFNGRITYAVISKNGFSHDTREELEKNNVLCLDLKEIEHYFNEITGKEITKQRSLDIFLN